MKPNKLHFPFFLFALLVQFFFSCEQKGTTTKEDTEGRSLLDKGDAYHKDQKYDKAFYYYNNAIEYSKSNDNKVSALIRIANLQLTQCDFIEAEASITEAIKTKENSKYDYYIYNTLGIAYEEQYNFDEAIANYNKSYRSTKGSINKLIIKNNIGVAYLEKKDFNQARIVLESALANDSLKKDPLIYAKIADNLGYAFFKLRNPKAIDLLNESQRIRDSLKSDAELIASYIHLSEYYQGTNPALALQMAQKAYQSAKAVNSPDDKIEALTYWIANAAPDQVKKLALQQIAISDSINRVRQTTKNQFAKIKYDSREAIKKQQKYKKNMWIALGVTLLITLAALVIFYYTRKRANERLKGSVNETESRIAKKIHDELANDVFQAMNYAESQDLQNPLNRETLVENLDAIYVKARDISQSNSEIKIDESYSKELLDLINSFNSTEVNIIVKNASAIDWSKVNKETKYAVYRVLQELLVNMKKHSEANLVAFSFENTSKYLEIKYSDNGKGINPDAFSKKGLLNAENRIRVLKGTFTFDLEANKGFKVTIQIPI